MYNFAIDIIKYMVSKEFCLSVLRKYFLDHKQEYGLDSMALFGSVARNEQTEESDVDVLYEGPANIILRIKMQEQLRTLLGCDVDIVRMRKSLVDSTFNKDIQQDLIYVA